jgi:hypothetical protein
VCVVAGPGSLSPMTGDDAAQQLEHEADRLEHHLDELQDHIAQADKSAASIREAANPSAAAGNWEDTRGTPGQGEDPAGAAAIAPADEAETNSPDDTPASDDDSDASDSDTSGDDDAVGGPTPGHAAGGDD